MTPALRFWTKVEFTDSCWLWTACRNSDGYGQIRMGSPSRMVQAHRWAYEFVGGVIPDGYELDHLCRVRHCVRPDHLEPVVKRVNILRGQGRGAMEKRQSHCLRGHALSGANLHVEKTGRRHCMECRRTRARAYKAAARG